MVTVVRAGRRGAAASVARGLRAGLAAPGVVFVLWGWSLLLALAATAPLAAWWFATVPYLPEADGAGDGLPLRLLAELLSYDRTRLSPIVAGVVAGLALVAMVGHAFLAGGVIAMLMRARPLGVAPPEYGVPFMPSFGREAGRFFARNVRLLLVHLVAGGAIVLALAAVGVAVVWPWRASVHPIPAGLSLAVPAALLALGLAFFSMVLDYARIRLVAGDARVMLAVWLGAVGFVARRFAGALGIWLALTLAVLAAAVLFGFFRALVPATTWFQIALLVVAQQAFMIVTTGLRVARLSAEIDYHAGQVGEAGRA
jgi:hypothetical protein